MQKKHASFTLIEMLVVLGIFSLVMTGILEFLTSFLNMRFNAQARQTISTQGNYAIDKIDLILRNGITVPNICMAGQGLGSAQSTFTTNLENKSDASTALMEKASVSLDLNNAQIISTQGAITQNLTLKNTGKSQLQASNLRFTCSKDPFTGGLIVTTNFTLSITRSSTGAQEQTISETFTKKTALRNQADFQN